jgi:heme/copper-type cytochrome/quinol oxidase subunit 1
MIRGVNQAQKVSVSIAVAAALIVGAVATSRVFANNADGGWFMYSPNSAPMLSSSRGPVVRDVVIWLAAIVIWLVVAWRLFRSKAE